MLVAGLELPTSAKGHCGVWLKGRTLATILLGIRQEKGLTGVAGPPLWAGLTSWAEGLRLMPFCLRITRP
jgi:hypothetical protein